VGSWIIEGVGRETLERETVSRRAFSRGHERTEMVGGTVMSQLKADQQ
jgi:hypothetical protein